MYACTCAVLWSTTVITALELLHGVPPHHDVGVIAPSDMGASVHGCMLLLLFSLTC
jgi:hypothetical protein